MKVGDPKTARLLVIVAIGAIVFVVIQLLPSKGTARNDSARAAGTAEPALAVEGLPETVANDSFSSPMLARSAAQPEGRQEGEGMRPLSPGVTGLLPSPMPNLSGGSKGGPINLASGDEKPPQEPEKPKRTALLSGVVSVDVAVAFIALDGKESRGCRAGELLGPGIKLLAIKENTAVLSLAGRRIVLEMGQVTEL
jgi:hypothetical protein